MLTVHVVVWFQIKILVLLIKLLKVDLPIIALIQVTQTLLDSCHISNHTKSLYFYNNPRHYGCQVIFHLWPGELNIVVSRFLFFEDDAHMTNMTCILIRWLWLTLSNKHDLYKQLVKTYFNKHVRVFFFCPSKSKTKTTYQRYSS